MLTLTLLFLAVFTLNVLPAFAPPTWMLLGFFGFQHQEQSPWQVALLAACAATAGRVVLARGAQRVANSRWVSAQMRDSLAAVAELLERRRHTSMLAFLLFAFSPLPSNVLFLAYGLTGAPLPRLALPFFIGRWVSYTVALAGGALAARHVELQLSQGWTGLYFLLTQSLLLLAVWLFARINWRRWLSRRGA
ncbi:hypothetical protein RQP53_11925 [Paucibacter sp. APW11]|uniref:TVP38/TMEM64 family membrane protein n=1 Tax=Roseateles aquae TaxID=3077235 RepID=A0ABU3PBS1_9BURK|nr:hypothetical protein [Paucibacter sp. APW11]MDT8999973.1 hypothetical protein [Paucibacter sp. APW11]